MRTTEKAIITGGTLLLLIAFIHQLYARGGPYFKRPLTIVDHIGYTHETHDALLLLPRVRPLLPHGAEVTCFRPIHGVQQYDLFNFLTAVGQLPDQRVMPPFAASLDQPRDSLVEYVVAVGEPFDHPAYKLVATFPEGRLYKVNR